MDKKNNDGLLEDMPEKRKKDGAFVTMVIIMMDFE